ncbi:hypothetical protein HOU41_gp053 [Proteus phage Stubb]|uniref:Uncharacterized protein n=1 Tax=Proteus phage Stubb TaxID=2315597 RepID=A0A3B8DJ15_9CAUD|nr:hypothetical protein HOU41_gp053 [Proteus phage Stubb]AYJ73193.1 hypothetical protein CPT_Stubb_053 [Proteus phage Stubb]
MIIYLLIMLWALVGLFNTYVVFRSLSAKDVICIRYWLYNSWKRNRKTMLSIREYEETKIIKPYLMFKLQVYCAGAILGMFSYVLSDTLRGICSYEDII